MPTCRALPPAARCGSILGMRFALLVVLFLSGTGLSAGPLEREMALAKQTAEQGIGDNDLKRLQRQFDSNKSTFLNIDQKQRFKLSTIASV